ncbi:hypothetical protein DRN63_00970 [Nanoarchaeota archaeon]|nr:MAG: hypothetical protein DRN63_00970 [Nanoarchaeota archaeon]
MDVLLIVVVSAICSFLNTFIYESLAKKDVVLKELNKEMNALRKKLREVEVGSKEFLEIQKKLLNLSKELTMKSLPKTIISGLPSYVILILGVTYLNLFPDWLSLILFIILSMIFSTLTRKFLQRKEEGK